MSISTKLTAAALAGLFSATVMTAGAAFAAEEGKSGCKGKDQAEKTHCNDKDDKNHCDGKAKCKGEKGDDKAEGEAK